MIEGTVELCIVPLLSESIVLKSTCQRIYISDRRDSYTVVPLLSESIVLKNTC